MSHAPTATRSTRRLPALFAALLCSLLLAGSAAAPASAQSLISPPQTKQEAEEQREAAAEAAAADDGGSLSIEAWLAIVGVALLAGATFYMLRDSSAAVAPERRAAPARPITPEKARGAPSTMFQGDDRPGGQTGKTQKRAKAKRQKQARRANRHR